MASKDRVLEALSGVMDPEIGRSLVELGMIRGVEVSDGKVAVQIALTTMGCPLKGRIADDARNAVLAVPGVNDVKVDLVAMTEQEKARAFGRGQEEERPHAENHVKQVIAVMSGKGGVGKSLVSGLLAVSLAKRGLKVGVLDADVTGPSIPKMFGLRTRPQAGPLGVLPVASKNGIGIISINLFLEREDEAVIWRGPMITSAIKQFWEDVVWGDLDYLFVDLPPGTSDAPLSVMQTLPVAGAVVVSSPQDLAGMIVRKAVRMTEHMEVPVVGVVENMSYFQCPDTGKRYEIFGPSRGEQLAKVAGAPLLAKLPIDPEAARLCDEGRIEDYKADAVKELGDAFLKATARVATVSKR
ncbi:MAG: Mrp/NBP35 family ATP-binding protein [Dehalococcoidales bacterium]|nr:Mrp/NBP35 family ATP-binding protein [Dehalococcoidales bacterium]